MLQTWVNLNEKERENTSETKEGKRKRRGNGTGRDSFLLKWVSTALSAPDYFPGCV